MPTWLGQKSGRVYLRPEQLTRALAPNVRQTSSLAFSPKPEPFVPGGGSILGLPATRSTEISGGGNGILPEGSGLRGGRLGCGWDGGAGDVPGAAGVRPRAPRARPCLPHHTSAPPSRL
ncbi:hypothetical protein B296_00039492 [Ensete ventricosum]|uniref:Uncharacterized protein n=1 Tax=Ensete ventricosum TaxID=4639 RepID=A0A426XHB7_ENSVE|nr:hypothetical protein B296_00039492 [Ensete ventricosum]